MLGIFLQPDKLDNQLHMSRRAASAYLETTPAVTHAPGPVPRNLQCLPVPRDNAFMTNLLDPFCCRVRRPRVPGTLKTAPESVYVGDRSAIFSYIAELGEMHILIHGTFTRKFSVLDAERRRAAVRGVTAAST